MMAAEILDVKVDGYTGRDFFDDVARDDLIRAIAGGMVQFERQQKGRVNFAKFPINGGQVVELRAEDLLPIGDRQGFLSNRGILRDLALGNLMIYPFEPRRLGRDSYDVTLGSEHWVMIPDHLKSPKKKRGGWTRLPFVQDIVRLTDLLEQAKISRVFNPYSKNDRERLWEGPRQALTAGEWRKKLKLTELDGIGADERLVVAGPGMMVLAHTQEFIGTGNKIALISARSSIGRSFWAVCDDSFLVHRDFKNRITLEVKSKIADWVGVENILIVGEPIAQMVFLVGEAPLTLGRLAATKYSQPELSLAQVVANWKPEMMLPLLYADRVKK